MKLSWRCILSFNGYAYKFNLKLCRECECTKRNMQAILRLHNLNRNALLVMKSTILQDIPSYSPFIIKLRFE
jgi:hypothetical protein